MWKYATEQRYRKNIQQTRNDFIYKTDNISNYWTQWLNTVELWTFSGTTLNMVQLIASIQF